MAVGYFFIQPLKIVAEVNFYAQKKLNFAKVLKI
jgi:hypothetical protein